MTFERHPLMSDDDQYLKYGRRQLSLEQREPLINQVTNSWQDDEKYRLKDEEYSDDERYPECCDVNPRDPFRCFVRNRRTRRMLLLLVVLLTGLYMAWNWYLRPQWEENRMYMAGLDKEYGGFGVQAPDQFADIIQLQELDGDKIPGGKADFEGKRRLIFVGDIHGCNKQLKKLLKRVNFDKDHDHLIATGDLVGKGPDPAGVIDTLIHHGAQSVRGNWDDRVLLQSKTYRSSDRNQPSTSTSSNKVTSVLDELKHHHLTYLRSAPLILHIPALSPPSHHAPALVSHSPQNSNLTHAILTDIYVVHAGLVPAIPPTRQDPYAVMNMRSIYPPSHTPSAHRKNGVAWEKVWNWYQKRLARGKKMPVFSYVAAVAPTETELADKKDQSSVVYYDAVQVDRDERSVGWADWVLGLLGTEREVEGQEWRRQKPCMVVYGHDSKRGLNLKRWSKGLDSGCVNGDRLSALVLDAWGRQDLVDVRCEDVKKADGEAADEH